MFISGLAFPYVVVLIGAIVTDVVESNPELPQDKDAYVFDDFDSHVSVLQGVLIMLRVSSVDDELELSVSLAIAVVNDADLVLLAFERA